MRTTLKLMIILLLAGNLSFAQTSNPIIKTTQLAENLYEFFIYIDNPNSVNVFAFIGADGILLIDAGFANTADLLKEELKKISDKEIRYLINTHFNDDHTDGNAFLGKDAFIVAHRETRNQLAKNTNFPPEGLPDITFQDSLTIWFNNEEIALKYLPGHSNNDIIVYFKKTNIAFLGDLVFSDSFPLIQFFGGVDSFEHSLAILSVMFPANTRILIGHGREMKPEELPPYLSMVRQTKDLVLKAIHEGKSPAEAKKSGVLMGWENWNSKVFPGYLTTDAWIDDLYAVLREGRESSANYILRKEFEQSGLQGMLTKYKSLTGPGKARCYFVETELNNWGYALMAEKKFSEAIEVLKIDAEQFPTSANAFDSLGEAYMKAGNKELAIRNYEKSLELNQNNTHAVEQLKKLRMK